MTRTVMCGECGGSGMRGSSDGLREFQCFDCNGEGQWEEEERADLEPKERPDGRWSVAA